MRTRAVIAAAAMSVPLIVGLPGPASAECVNGINVSGTGDATQTNDCTTTVQAPGVPTPPTIPTP